MFELTPVEYTNGIYFKREDYFKIGNVNGGKARTAMVLCKEAKNGIVTAGSRYSPQIKIISELAKIKKLPFIAVTPIGKITEELQFAIDNNAKLNQIKMGFNNNLISKAKKISEELNYSYIPFGMECDEAVNQSKFQVQNIPNKIKNLVIIIGSGMTLSGILHGIEYYKKNIKNIIGIIVGANPEKRLNKYAPENWKEKVTLIKSKYDYHQKCNDILFDLKFNQTYEAKALSFLNKGDLFWIIGK